MASDDHRRAPPKPKRRRRRGEEVEDRERVVIIAGAGITGLCTAYYLASKYRIRSAIIERTGSIAPGASGRAAGFLARHWNDGTPTENLTRRSFDLHSELALEVLGADRVQYRRLPSGCASVTLRRRQQNNKRRKGTQQSHDNHCIVESKANVLEWFDGSNLPPDVTVEDAQSMGDETNIAQVTPRLFCEELWRAIQAMGLTTLRQGRVTGAVRNGTTGRFAGAGVVVRGEAGGGGKEEAGVVVPGDALVYACGPWSANIMRGIKGHAVTMPTSRVLGQVLFGYVEGDVDTEVEIFARPNGTAFCTALPGQMTRVEELPGEETIDEGVIEAILERVRTYDSPGGQLLLGRSDSDAAKRNSSSGTTSPPRVGRSACYQPVTDDFLPVIGELPRRATGGCDSCYMASGNNCWGILLGPATGESVADLIATGRSGRMDLGAFRPGRFRDLKPVPW